MSGNLSKSAFFEGEVGHFERRFQREGASPTNHCWCHKIRVIAVSCGIKISAVHHLVLSQYTRLTDRQTDRQNCDSNTVRCITCSRTVKTGYIALNKYILYFVPNSKVIVNTISVNNDNVQANSESVQCCVFETRQ